MTLEQQLHEAVEQHRAGRLPQAEALYRSILAQDPRQAGALHLLGVLLGQSGRSGEGAELVERAVLLRPEAAEFRLNLCGLCLQLGQPRRAAEAAKAATCLQGENPAAWFALGAALGECRQPEEAAAAYRRAIALRPEYAEAHCNLAVLLASAKRFDEAAAAFRRAIALLPGMLELHNNLGLVLLEQGRPREAAAEFALACVAPGYAEAPYNLGTALGRCGRLAEAEAAYRRALELKADYAEAMVNLGSLLAAREDAEALPLLRRAAALRPDLPEALYNLGCACTKLGRPDEAVECLRRAATLRPQWAETYAALADALTALDKLDDAETACRTAMDLKPELPEAYLNMAVVLARRQQYAEAIRLSRRAVGLNNELTTAHVNLGSLLLLHGDFEEGWREYEWRLKESPEMRCFPQPHWAGEDAVGKTLLLHAEQGLGDTLHFVRYAALAAPKAGRVVTWVPAALARLLRRVDGVGQLVSGDKSALRYDVHCPLMSLPCVLGTRAANIPAPLGYIRPEPQCVAKWSARLGERSRQLRVGVCWAGNPKLRNDRHRSLALSQLAPLGQVRGVRLYSLQKGAGAEQAKAPPAGMELIDFTSDVTDFEETAGLVANLDLVISADTAVAHLAGAMGKACWVLLPLVPDWRWQLGREDSPWYPTLRLFRQKQAGDWAEVVTRAVAELREQAQGAGLGA